MTSVSRQPLPTKHLRGTLPLSIVPSARPRWLSTIPENIPKELTDSPSWYLAVITPKVGKVGSWDKIPSDPATGRRATWSDPDTRCTFSDAFMGYEAGRGHGIGYMLDDDSGVIGIDLDKCIAPDGSIAAWALDIVHLFEQAYWEKSISGTGLRGFCRGTLPDGVDGVRDKIEGCSVELYSGRRFLVVTGHALEPGAVDTLPELQEAVSALHGRLTCGRTRSTGTAIASGLTGRVEDLSPEELAVLEHAMCGRKSVKLARIWSRDDLHASGASEDDWFLETELCYWAIRAGLDGDTLALAVERIMRVGPYRAKWDHGRNGVSWLAQDVANAVRTTQDRLAATSAGRPIPEDDDDDDPADAPPADETPEQTIARQAREIAVAAAVGIVRVARINSETAKRLAAEEAATVALAAKRESDALVTAMFDVLAIPDAQLNARGKIVALAVARESSSRNSRGIFTLTNTTLSQLTGLTENVVSEIMQDLPARDGAPFTRFVSHVWRETSPGITEPRAAAQVRITTAEHSAIAVIRALPLVGGPSSKEQQRLAKGRAKTAARQEAKIVAEVGKRISWGWCSQHEDEDVTLKGHCQQCDEVVGTRPMTADDFKALDPDRVNPGIQESLPDPPPVHRL